MKKYFFENNAKKCQNIVSIKLIMTAIFYILTKIDNRVKMFYISDEKSIVMYGEIT